LSVCFVHIFVNTSFVTFTPSPQSSSHPSHLHHLLWNLWPSITFTPSPLKALAIHHIYTISPESSDHPSHLHHLLWNLWPSVTFTPSPLKALAIRHICTFSSESSGHPSHLHHLLWKLGVLSHLHHLLWKLWAKLNQTWQECSLDCPLMCIGNICFLNQFMNLQRVIIIRGPSWSWSYGNWIYNYAISTYHRS